MESIKKNRKSNIVIRANKFDVKTTVIHTILSEYYGFPNYLTYKIDLNSCRDITSLPDVILRIIFDYASEQNMVHYFGKTKMATGLRFKCYSCNKSCIFFHEDGYQQCSSCYEKCPNNYKTKCVICNEGYKVSSKYEDNGICINCKYWKRLIKN